jgi:hypothetical protein
MGMQIANYMPSQAIDQARNKSSRKPDEDGDGKRKAGMCQGNHGQGNDGQWNHSARYFPHSSDNHSPDKFSGDD